VSTHFINFWSALFPTLISFTLTFHHLATSFSKAYHSRPLQPTHFIIMLTILSTLLCPSFLHYQIIPLWQQQTWHNPSMKTISLYLPRFVHLSSEDLTPGLKNWNRISRPVLAAQNVRDTHQVMDYLNDRHSVDSMNSSLESQEKDEAMNTAQQSLANALIQSTTESGFMKEA